ncbi:MAG: glycosyltransferase family 4 protein [Chitinophagaceae bacterium]|nr:glycosyltransferase family 4 protein [Chitinophagaceae bacterium]
MSTVYTGVSDYFKPVTDADMLKRFSRNTTSRRFFFFLGNTDPKKNTKGTLQAFSDYRKQTGDDMKLVMIDYDKTELEKMLSEIGDEDLINHIVLTGYITNTDLPAIYSQCSLFLYPSLRESFGIPIIEAMASGAPVITSVTSSMPEIAGKAAVLVDPFKPDEITTAMRMVMCDELLRQEMVAEGFGQAAKFSWKTMGGDVRKRYEGIVNAKRAHSKIK